MPPVRKKKVDANQPGIVEALTDIPGVTVELDHDDIIVGFRGQTFWYEIKNPSRVLKNGTLSPAALEPSQKRILSTFTGHYRVVWDVNQILEDMGITS